MLTEALRRGIDEKWRIKQTFESQAVRQ